MTLCLKKLESKINAQIACSKENSSNMNFDSHFNSKGRELRISILDRYNKSFSSRSLNKSISISKIIKTANQPYSGRTNGLFYADDFVKLIGHSNEWTTIQGLSNPNFWNVGTNDCFFKINDGINPSDAIRAFFVGPTFPDCGNVIQAAIYLSILNRVGDQVFNKLF